jgi:hypothetical protein
MEVTGRQCFMLLLLGVLSWFNIRKLSWSGMLESAHTIRKDHPIKSRNSKDELINSHKICKNKGPESSFWPERERSRLHLRLYRKTKTRKAMWGLGDHQLVVSDMWVSLSCPLPFTTATSSFHACDPTQETEHKNVQSGSFMDNKCVFGGIVIFFFYFGLKN